jgi:DNA polymerase-4
MERPRIMLRMRPKITRSKPRQTHRGAAKLPPQHNLLALPGDTGYKYSTFDLPRLPGMYHRKQIGTPQTHSTIAHADMDAFYAAIEQLDHPELRGQSVLVGPASGRGVVLTASYEARPFKVGSAMPMRQALQRCPGAIIVPPRFARYAEISRIIMATFRDFSPLVEPLSMDEAFIDLSGTEHLFGTPKQAAVAIKRAIFDATGGLHASVGVASSKFVAKVASSHAKPNGLCVVPTDAARDWLAPMSVARLWGAGPKTQARLQSRGYHTIGDVAQAKLADLETYFGSLGTRLHCLARAEDPRRVSHQRRARSMSCDRTLRADISATTDLQQHLMRAADQLGTRLRKSGYQARGVRIKLKTSSFQTLSRQCTLAEPTDVGQCLYAAGAQLLARMTHPGPFRMVGMAAHSISEGTATQQLSLLQVHGRDARLERTVDQLNGRFGSGTIRRACDVSSNTLLSTAPNLDFVERPNNA